MRKFRSASYVLAMTIFALLSASVAQAQATRTWVSGVGDDANPCSRTAPCKTFAGAISKTASPGEINALDPGGFGAVTITKSVTIDGGMGQIAGVLASGVQGIVINATTNDVVILRNLDINGAGTTLGTNGINIITAKAVYIEHCHIFNFSSNGIVDNRTTNSTEAELFVNDCMINTNGQGIAVAGSSTGHTTAHIDHCQIQGNSGFGASVSNGNVLNVLHCNLSGNGGEGVKIDNASGGSVTSCALLQNGSGVVNNGAFLLLADSTIEFNTTGVSGTITTFGNNNVRFNAGGNTLPLPVGQQ